MIAENKHNRTWACYQRIVPDTLHSNARLTRRRYTRPPRLQLLKSSMLASSNLAHSSNAAILRSLSTDTRAGSHFLQSHQSIHWFPSKRRSVVNDLPLSLACDLASGCGGSKRRSRPRKWVVVILRHIPALWLFHILTTFPPRLPAASSITTRNLLK